MVDRLTLLDLQKQKNPDGSSALIAEVLDQMCPFFQDGPVARSNGKVSHRTTYRTALPTVSFVELNQGTPRSKSGTKQKVDTMGMINVFSDADARWALIDGAGVAAYRRNEDRAFLQSIAQKLENTIIYGDELTSPLAFTGFAKRTGSLATSIQGSQVRSMGTVSGGDGTSIYVVDWGEDGCQFIIPPDGENGTEGGIKAENHDKVLVSDPDGNQFFAFVTEFTVLLGLTVKDPRHVGRLANIDLSDSLLDSPTQGNLLQSLGILIDMMPAVGGTNRVLYAPREIVAAFNKQAENKSNLMLTMDMYLGKKVPHYRGYPLRPSDQVSKAESTVS